MPSLTAGWRWDDGAPVGEAAALHLKVGQALQVVVAQRVTRGQRNRRLQGQGQGQQQQQRQQQQQQQQPRQQQQRQQPRQQQQQQQQQQMCGTVSGETRRAVRDRTSVRNPRRAGVILDDSDIYV
jgi:hypothetical protein